MTFVPRSRVLPRSLWRPALFFFAVAQIFLSFAPLLERTQGPDARAHVEERGTTLHHVHNEAHCAACTARHLLASANAEPAQEFARSSRERVVPEEASLSVASAWRALSRSRAPPSDLIV